MRLTSAARAQNSDLFFLRLPFLLFKAFLPFSGRDQKRVVDLPSFTFVKTPIPPVEYTSLPEISLPFSGRDQKRVVELPSLNSPQRKRRRCGGVGRICKIRVFRPEKEAPGF